MNTTCMHNLRWLLTMFEYVLYYIVGGVLFGTRLISVCKQDIVLIHDWACKVCYCVVLVIYATNPFKQIHVIFGVQNMPSKVIYV